MGPCCSNSRNECENDKYYPDCIDHTSSNDFIFALAPNEPERFGPKPGGYMEYQFAGPSYWPYWGNDLAMGTLNGPAGNYGYCNQGSTYSGKQNWICGGGYDPPSPGHCKGKGCWGSTELEVWRPRSLCKNLTEAECEGHRFQCSLCGRGVEAPCYDPQTESCAPGVSNSCNPLVCEKGTQSTCGPLYGCSHGGMESCIPSSSTCCANRYYGIGCDSATEQCCSNGGATSPSHSAPWCCPKEKRCNMDFPRSGGACI